MYTSYNGVGYNRKFERRCSVAGGSNEILLKYFVDLKGTMGLSVLSVTLSTIKDDSGFTTDA